MSFSKRLQQAIELYFQDDGRTAVSFASIPSQLDQVCLLECEMYLARGEYSESFLDPGGWYGWWVQCKMEKQCTPLGRGCFDFDEVENNWTGHFSYV